MVLIGFFIENFPLIMQGQKTNIKDGPVVAHLF